MPEPRRHIPHTHHPRPARAPGVHPHRVSARSRLHLAALQRHTGPAALRSAAPLLTRTAADRLASAFELCADEVLADAHVITAWRASPAELDAWLSAHHQWQSDEAHYFVWWIRLQTWLARNGLAH